MQYENLGRILYMSITICIHFSLTATVNTIYPELADQKGYPYIGQLTIMVTYIMEILANIYGLRFISLKRSGLSFYICGILPLFTFVPALIINRCEDKEGICAYHYIAIISILGFALQGTGLGAYFLLQNCYQSACATIKSRDLLNGVSYTIIGLAFLVGNSYSLPLIGYLGRENFFIVLAIAQFSVNFFFLFLPNPGKQEISLVHVEEIIKMNNTTNINDQSVMDSDKSTSLIQNEQGPTDPTDPVKDFIYNLRQASVQKLVPYFFLTGIVIGFEFGQFYQVITQCLPEGLDQVIVNQKTFNVFIFFGCGEILSGPIVALIAGRIDMKYYLLFYSYLTGFTIIITTVNLYLKSYQFCFIIALFWGTIDNFGQATSNMIISKHWGDNFSVFSIYLVFQNLGAILFQFFPIYLPYSLMIYGLSFCLFCQILTSIETHIFINKYYNKEININNYVKEN